MAADRLDELFAQLSLGKALVGAANNRDRPPSHPSPVIEDAA
jgi:hypothetical protein